MHKIIVYEATNAINGKRYIGITRRGLAIRRKRHFHTAMSGGGAVIGAAIRKYGKDAFRFKTLIVCPDFDYAGDMERALIALYHPEYNLTAGGGGVSAYKLSEEARKAISSAQKGNKHWLGKTHQEETKLKMSAARKAHWGRTPHSRKQYQPKNGPKRGLQIADNATGVIYESVMHAARANGLTRENIRSSLRGNGGIGLAGRFVYYGETVANSQMERHDNQRHVFIRPLAR